MKRNKVLKHEFVEYIPAHLEENTIYVSVAFATVVHKCCCGCGNEVVTPLSPTDWKLFFDGQAISLTPSIGNWNFKCRSHYWIDRNKVKWARSCSQKEINANRACDSLSKARYDNDGMDTIANAVSGSIAGDISSKTSLWWKLKKILFR
jgi:hypothetical protein